MNSAAIVFVTIIVLLGLFFGIRAIVRSPAFIEGMREGDAAYKVVDHLTASVAAQTLLGRFAYVRTERDLAEFLLQLTELTSAGKFGRMITTQEILAATYSEELLRELLHRLQCIAAGKM